jgi:hypothetical protein
METMTVTLSEPTPDELRRRVLTALEIVESMRRYEQERGSVDYNLDVLAIILSSVVGRVE